MIGYQPDLKFLGSMGITLQPETQRPLTNRRDARKRATRDLSGGRDRRGHAHQRDLHRERPLPRQKIADAIASAVV